MNTELGRVVGLFVQRRPVKQGRAPLREYRTDDIVAVPSVRVDPDGVVGETADGELILDAHHVRHPATRDRRGLAGVSFMATGDCAALRARYGDHAVDGSAGATVLIEHPGLAMRTPESFGRLSIGAVELTGIHIAEPCVEFSRFCLELPPSPVVGDDVKQALIDLDDGHRGYKGVATTAGRIVLGDRVRVLTV